MSSTRAKLAAAVASFGVLGLGWGVATANGTTVAATRTTTTATTDIPTTPTTTTPTTATATGGYADGTWTGETEVFRFGRVAVTVTVKDGSITSVTEKLVSDGDRHSDQINARALPTLKSAILAADSADVSTISGATYTTEAYLTSLQSALDQAS